MPPELAKTDAIGPADTTAVVTDELPCIGCGYLLRGLTLAGRCPECGTPVMAAFIERTLAFADPAWLALLQVAPRMLLLATVVFVASLLAIAAQIADGNTWSKWLWLFYGGYALTALLLAVSCWFATSPNPTISQSHARPILIARTALLVMFAWAMAHPLSIWGGLGPELIAAMAGFASPLGVAGALAVWGMTRHFEVLARRAGDQFFVKRAVGYRRGFVVGWTALASGAMLTALVVNLPRPWGALLSGLGSVLIGTGVFACLIFGLLTILFPLYLVRHLREARHKAEQARQTVPLAG